ncbi:hypothetical protein KPH14_011015 [Odynerus spinipes]|uniref:Uncharacterized protein n=1 Tax=Odynerus spinipes TaxID=1348599 RepID=A0AAD9RWB7_9HYME|nr:hypothetical protein KPH14_011015 [Odynerus spinipes]
MKFPPFSSFHATLPRSKSSSSSSGSSVSTFVQESEEQYYLSSIGRCSVNFDFTFSLIHRRVGSNTQSKWIQMTK